MTWVHSLSRKYAEQAVCISQHTQTQTDTCTEGGKSLRRATALPCQANEAIDQIGFLHFTLVCDQLKMLLASCILSGQQKSMLI